MTNKIQELNKMAQEREAELQQLEDYKAKMLFDVTRIRTEGCHEIDKLL